MKYDVVAKYLKIVGTTATILALLSLACLLAGSYFNSQIYIYLTEQTTTSTSSASVSTVTTIVTSASLSECTVHPCNFTRALSDTVIGSESISGYVRHALPAAEAKAAWQTKEFLDNFGTVLLLVSVALSILHWGITRRR
jgi:hypothetical protein